MVYCLNLYDDAVLWNRAVPPGVDRLAISPDGQLLYVPTWEDGRADYINVVDANTGEVVRRVYFSSRSHDTQYPLSGRMSGEFRLKGERRRPLGTGSMRIDDGVAYGEPIQNATASLRFDGNSTGRRRIHRLTSTDGRINYGTRS